VAARIVSLCGAYWPRFGQGKAFIFIAMGDSLSGACLTRCPGVYKELALCQWLEVCRCMIRPTANKLTSPPQSNI
jgi:hypothetical protein